LIALAVIVVGMVSAGVASALTIARPTGLTAAATSSTTVSLQWHDAANNEIGFEVQRTRAEKTAWKKIATAPVNATSFGDTGLTASTAYKYRVRALKPGSGASSFSNTVTVKTLGGTPPPPVVPAPSGLTVTADSCAFALAKWNPIFDANNSYHVAKYNLYRNNVLVQSVNAPATTAIDTPLNPRTSYTWAVTAADESNHESAKSSTVSATTGACPPAGAWAKTAGGAGSETSKTAAVDRAGNTVVGGSFRQTADFGSGPIAAAANGDLFVAKYSPDHTLVWVKHWPSSSTTNELNALGTDGAGNIFMAGAFFGTLNLGGVNLLNATAGTRDAFIAELAPDGTHEWSKRFGSTRDDAATGVAVDSTGAPIFTGSFWGLRVDFGGPMLTAGGDPLNYQFAGDDAFVLRAQPADGSTQAVWQTTCGGVLPSGIALDSANNVVLTGYLQAACRFTPNGTLFTPSNYGAFVAKFSPAGGFSWARLFDGATYSDYGNAVAVDGNGDVVAAGTFTNSVDFGDATRGVAGGWNPWAYVVKLTGSSGATQWSKAYGNVSGYSYSNGNGVAVDSQGRVTVVGSFQATSDFGGGGLDAGLQSNGSYATAAFVAEYSPAGAHIASNCYTGRSNTQAYDVTPTPSGAVVTGSFSDTVDFGFGPVTSAGFSDIFILNTGR
jgi:hypothetical protein